MQAGEEVPWRFSPLDVVAESVAFVAAHLPLIATWSVAPLLYGLAFQFFMPSSGGEGRTVLLPALLLMAFILLWIRVPMELRLYRKLLLDESPKHFYGLQLVDGRTWSYVWAYLRVIGLFLASFGPGVLMIASLAAPLLKGSLAPGESPDPMTSLVSVSGAFVLLGILYVMLAPRVILLFPDVAMGGQGRLFGPGAMGELGKQARWRMVAVMAMIWAPEHTMNVLGYVGGDWETWKEMSQTWWFSLFMYLLGFATMIVSVVAGGVMYRRLRAGIPAMAYRETREEDE